MKRNLLHDLSIWKGSTNPYMLTGSRQVGKTWLLDSFCRENFDRYLYFNLERDSDVAAIFEETINPEEIVKSIGYLKNIAIDTKNTVFFFDEIQVSERAVMSLKYFCDSDTQYNVVCAGSLLGVALNRFQSSFPVGKVRIKNLEPMNFEEFLSALGMDELILAITDNYGKNQKMPEPVHRKLLNLYKDYLYVGGMPASVLEYIKAGYDLQKYDRTVKQNIIDSYIADMSKYTTNAENTKIKQIYNSVPKQLGREKTKFNYKLVSANAKGRSYGTSIDWLSNSGMVSICRLVETPRIPLRVYEHESIFKLYLNDVGLLVELAGMKPVDVMGKKLDIFKGMLTENYVAQTLKANNVDLNYWSSTNTAEIDFLININGEIIPVEVKAAMNTKSKSLSVYREKYNPEYSIRLSGLNFGLINGIKSVPLYAAWLIGREEQY